VISGFNISNSIGNICFSGYKEGFFRKLIEQSYNNHVKLYMSSLVGKKDELVRDEYFPGLDEDYAKYLSTMDAKEHKGKQ
jgi:hypothetical protein